MIKRILLLLLGALPLLVSSRASAAAGYTFVEGYNVLDTNNNPGFTGTAGGTNYAGTAAQERDIAVDTARGIIYIGHGTGGVPDGRGSTTHISAFVVTNGARAGSNFRDTGLIGPAAGQPTLTFNQSLAYDAGSDKLWVLGSPLNATPVIFSAPGGTLGGAPNGDGISAVNAALTKAFQPDTNLLDVGVYVPGVAGLPSRGGVGRGLTVRTINGTNTTVYLGMGNHVQAWRNDGTNQTWRRIWATQRPPTANLVTTRVALTGFNGVNGLAVDDGGNCYFSVQNTGGRIWCVRPSLIEFVADPMSLDFNDLAFGGSNEREILSLIVPTTTLLTTPPQSITFARFDSQKSLFVSYLPLPTSRGVTRLDVDDSFSFTNSGAYIPARAIDGFGSGQPAGGQDTILATMRLKSTPNITQPYGATSGLLYTEVDSVTNPTYLYVDAFVTDTNKGQTIPTAAIFKVRLPADTNPPSILTQPVSQTLLEGGTINLSVAASGLKPLHYQWQSNTVDFPNATNSSLVIVPASTNHSGVYHVVITNALGTITSSNATVTVNPLVRSAAMNPLWSLAPGARPYLSPTDGSQRAITYNPGSHNVLLVSRTPTTNVYVLDGTSGDDLYQLGLGPIVTGGTFPISKIGSSDDGLIYAANLAQNGENFRLYVWNGENANDTPTVAFSGNPTPGVTNRWGDTFDVRGSGSEIQILAGTRNSNVVAIFTSADGFTFTATPITVADAGANSFGLGLAFGTGNTFWGKGDGSGPLRQVQFDLGAGTGTTLHSYSAAGYTSSALPVAVETNLNLLASISIENPDNLRLYTIYNLANPPVLVDQELFPSDNDNLNVTGALDFGGGNLYALDSNNGILAMSLGTIPGPPPGPLTITRSGGIVTLTWAGSFTLQSSTVVTGPYTDVVGATSGYTDSGAAQKFFRLRN